jgi:Spy/CpxP family protein refolding chaperone
MYPGMIAWWRGRHGGASHGCGGGHAHAGWGEHGHHQGGDDGGAEFHASGGVPDDGGAFGAFGVRRPLRFLSYKLGLSEPQIGELAKILNQLKTERAQAAVDHRRSVAGFADALEGEAFDDAKAKAAAAERVKSAERLRDAVIEALRTIHRVLQPQQRAQLAYLIRTGALLI